MKKFIVIALFAIITLSCGNGEQNKQNTNEFNDPSVVNVFYFHGKQRCKTCIAVENVAKETVNKLYANNNKVKYTEIDTSDKTFEGLVEKYEVSWNALIINKGDNTINITEQAFASAVNNPQTLEELIKAEVNKRLN